PLALSSRLRFYYTAVGFSVICLATVFGFSLKDANGLGNWNWGFNVIAVVLVGMISDRFRVRKPFMVFGGILGAVMVVVYLEQAGHHPGYYTLAIMLALLSLGLGIAYTPWMASFTETVEARNPALIATGLAIWGWIIRIVVFGAYLCLPLVVNTVTPLVNYGAQVSAYATQYKTELAFATAHPAVLATISQNKAAINGVIAVAPDLQKVAPHAADLQTIAPYSKQLTTIAPYAAQLTALSKVPPGVFAYLKAHGADVQNAAAKTAGQWKTWYWICFGGIVFFLLSIPLLRGRWRTRDAKRNEAEHEAKVQEELAKLQATV